MVVYKYLGDRLICPANCNRCEWREEEMFQPQIRSLDRVLPAVALVVVGIVLLMLLSQ